MLRFILTLLVLRSLPLLPKNVSMYFPEVKETASNELLKFDNVVKQYFNGGVSGQAAKPVPLA